MFPQDYSHHIDDNVTRSSTHDSGDRDGGDNVNLMRCEVTDEVCHEHIIQISPVIHIISRYLENSLPYLFIFGKFALSSLRSKPEFHCLGLVFFQPG